MINTIIIDDEANNVAILQKLLTQFCPVINITGAVTDSRVGMELIKDQKPQLVFLDIEMPYGNAFELLEKIMPVDFEVIFVTAFDKYAIQAFEYAALDYLLKPVNIEKLKRAVERAEQHINDKNSNERINSLISNLHISTPDRKKIALPVAEGLIFEEINNLVRLQSEGNYSIVFTKNQKKMIVSKPLREFEDLLPQDIFCRLHHSHLVNVNFISKYFKGRGGYVELEDGTTIEVSTRKKDIFLGKFRS